MIEVPDLLSLQVRVSPEVVMYPMHLPLSPPCLIANERSKQVGQRIKGLAWEVFVASEKKFHVLSQGIQVGELRVGEFVQKVTLWGDWFTVQVQLWGFETLFELFLHRVWLLFLLNLVIFWFWYQIALKDGKLFLLLIIQFFINKVHQSYLVQLSQISVAGLKHL